MFSSTAFAQDAYEDFARKFIDNYNAESFDANYDLTADGFKSQVTRESFTKILTDAFSRTGQITSYKVLDNNGQGKVYQLTCERAAFTLSVSLDAEGKAAGFFIKSIQKPAENND